MGRKSKITDEQLVEAVKESYSVVGVLKVLGLSLAGGSHAHYSKRIKKLGLDTGHFKSGGSTPENTQKKSPEQILILMVPGSPRAPRYQLKRALIESGISYQCSECGISEWFGKQLTLQVDHVDGNWSDNRIENLRFLCPNCHTLTPTYGRRKDL